MNLSDLRRVQKRPTDLLFLAILALSLLLAIGALTGGMERRDALLLNASARKIDVNEIRKQISEGNLSGHKAMFYRKVPAN